jgi:hypothetical protein
VPATRAVPDAVLLLQLAVYAACLFFIANGAANAAEGRGSALDQGVESRKGGEMWKDLFYINAFTQVRANAAAVLTMRPRG